MFPWKRLEYNNEWRFLHGLSWDIITETSLEVSQLSERAVRESMKRGLGAVEESPLLKAVIREKLVKTQQTEKT
jgi:hypothetical protein